MDWRTASISEVDNGALRHSRDRKKVILVVEDEPLIRIMLADEFQEVGFEVLEAEHAAEALALMERSWSIDAMCTDVRMPGEIDGLALARTVRARRPWVKIVVVSGHLPHPPPPELQDAYFPKPYHMAAVVARTVELLA